MKLLINNFDIDLENIQHAQGKPIFTMFKLEIFFIHFFSRNFKMDSLVNSVSDFFKLRVRILETNVCDLLRFLSLTVCGSAEPLKGAWR